MILCFWANVLAALVRINISIAAPLMIRSFGWDDAQMGVVFSSFFLGYVLFMIPGGVLADRFGARRVLAWGVGLWSAFSMVTAGCSTIGPLLVLRFLTGACQAVNFPCMNNLIATQVPLEDRAKVQGFVLSGMMLSSVIGLPTGSWIVKAWGWPAIFLAFGGAGAPWLWAWLRRAPPGDSVSHPALRPAKPPIPWRVFFTHRSTLGLTLSYFSHNYASYFLLSWLPTYLIQARGFSVSAMGFAAALPALASLVSMNASGWVSDHLVQSGASRQFARKLLLCGGMAGSGLFLLTLLWLSNPYAAVVAIVLSGASRSLATPAYWTLSMDMAPRHAGILSSIMNTSGNLAGVVAPAVTGFLLSSTGSWTVPIAAAALISVTGALVALPTVRADEVAP